MKRAIGIAAMSIAMLSTAGCPLLTGRIKKPKVTLQNIEIKDVDFQGARLAAILQVQNQMDVGLSMGKVTWSVTLEGNRLVTGELPPGTAIPANGTIPVTIPFAMKFEDLYKLSQKYKDADTAPYRLEGSVEVETPVGPVAIPFHHDGTVPVLKVPEIDLGKVEVRGVSFSGADVRFSFKVKNPNSIALSLTSFDYALTLAGARVADGKIPGALELAAKGSSAFDADVKVSFTQAATAAQALASKSTADYSVAGSIGAKTPWGQVSTPYTRSGTVKISR